MNKMNKLVYGVDYFGLRIFLVSEKYCNDFGIEPFTLDYFRNYIFNFYENIEGGFYDFKFGVTYNIHLVNERDYSFLGVVPIKLNSLMPDEELIDTCYNNLKRQLDMNLDDSIYDGFVILFISKDIVTKGDYRELIIKSLVGSNRFGGLYSQKY